MKHNRMPRGWWCAQDAVGNPRHDGPCPAWGRWWNLKAPRALRRTKRSVLR